MHKKRFIALLLALSLLFAASLALAAEQRVFDQAGLLSTAETELLEERIASLRETLSVDIVLLTADQGVYDTMAYADDFYDNGGFGAGTNYTGVLYFIDMQNRTAWISTTGDMIDYIDDPREEMILDDQMNYLPDGDYYGAFSAALDWTEELVLAGVGEGHYAYDEQSGDTLQPEDYGSTVDYDYDAAPRGFYISPGGALICLGLGLGAGFLARGIVKGRYKKPFQAVAYPFREKSRLNLMVNTSECTGKFVTTRVIPRTDDSTRSGGGGSRFGGGGSGVHISSSGRSHGGGGRKF